MSQASPVSLAAAALSEARRGRKPVPQISQTYGILTLAGAYQVAEINTQAQLAAGRRILGKKVGLTSRAVQQQLGVDQPDFGILFDDMEYLSGQDVPMARLIQDTVRKALADELLFGHLTAGGKVTIDIDADEKVKLSFEENPKEVEPVV